MNSVNFYLFKIKRFTIYWVAFMHHLIFSGKGLPFSGIGGGVVYLMFRMEVVKNEKCFISNTAKTNLR